MARGHLYEISANPQQIGSLDADSFAGSRDGASFAEWYEDVVADAKGFVCRRLQKCGSSYGNGGEDGETPYVVLTQACKEAYFEKRYCEFIDLVRNVNLKEFASNIDAIMRLAFDNYGDAVYLADDNYAVTMDSFIRDAEPGVRYYIGNILYMH